MYKNIYNYNLPEKKPKNRRSAKQYLPEKFLPGGKNTFGEKYLNKNNSRLPWPISKSQFI